MTLLALAVPLACGFLLVRLLLPARRFLWLSLSLGAGLGMGIASCLFFLALMMGLPVVVLAAVEAAGLGGLVVAWKRLARPPEEAGEDRGNRVVAVGFALSLALALAATVWRLSSAPHGHWDAWAIWNLRARFLARPGQWRDAFHSLLVAHHPDYPLLIPALIARCWRYAGESAAAPAMVSVLFSLATLGVLVSGIALLRGKTAGQMAGLVLAATLFFWKETAA
ncbi:MAG: hypothetical protein HYR60_28840, partial [Acidobacteria bacterium]|nr:hypothetical protein [Acidobacteriota bacterium]